MASAYSSALRRLARRDHSVEEIRRALAREGHPEDDIEATVRRLRAEGVLNDRGFAARFARSRMAHQGLGRNRVRQGLRSRGVGRKDAEAGLSEALEEVSEAASIDALARRYWRQRTPRDEPRQRLRRLWAFLVRRGFPAAMVYERLRRLWPRFGDALEGLEPLGPEET